MAIRRKVTGIMMPALMWATSAHAATIAVTSIDDDGPGNCDTSCTLRDAVTISSPGDTIELPAGLIVLDDARGEIVTTRDLTILGAGRDSTYVSGNDATRIFRVTGGELLLKDLTLQNGVSVGDSGYPRRAGAYNGAGGAIRIESDATVLILGARFSDNQAIGGNGGVGDYDGGMGGGGGGGGHGGEGKFNAEGPGEDGHFGGGGGGAGFHNTLSGPGGTGGFGGGGGGSASLLFNPGSPGGVGGGKGGDAELNAYSGGGGGAGMGGAIYVEGSLALRDVEFLGNEAIGGNGGAASGGGGGGGGGAGMGSAIFTRGDETVTASLCVGYNVTFTGGSVLGGSGGAHGPSGGTDGEAGSGLETASGRYEAGVSVCRTEMKVFDAHAAVPTGSETSVLFTAQVSDSFGLPVTGQVTFSLKDGDGVVMGAPVTATVSSGQAIAVYQLTASTPGDYIIHASFEDADLRYTGEAQAVLRVPEAPVVVRLQDLPVGDDDCAQGGIQIDSGQDDGDPSGIPFDDVLQDGEVEETHYVCDGADGVDGTNGENGYPVVVNITPIDEGDEECPAGGRLIEAGLDDGSNDSTANDGVLQKGEVQSTNRVCHGTNGANGPQGAPGGCSSTGTPPFAILSAVAMILAGRRLYLR